MMATAGIPDESSLFTPINNQKQKYKQLKCSAKVLYSTANDPQPQMIPKMDRKWSSTASDPQSRPQMIPKEK